MIRTLQIQSPAYQWGGCTKCLRATVAALRRLLLSAAVISLGALFFMLPDRVAAQSTYPNRPIRLVVPFPAGESIDVIARVVAKRWSEVLGQSIVVENHGGAGGMIGTDMVAKAAPDGYTILMGNSGGLAIIPAIKKKTPYDITRDFEPISQLSNVPFFIFASAKTPFKTVQSVIDYAKKNPGKLNFASTGIGSGVHMAGEVFKSVTDVDMTHVPYKGVSMALTELISGSVELVFYPVTFVQLVKDGKLRPLAIMATSRASALPDTPTTAEIGMPNLVSSSWHAILAPAGTSPLILNKLSETLATVIAEPAIRESMLARGIDPVGSSPTELKAFMKKEFETWRAMATKAGISLD